MKRDCGSTDCSVSRRADATARYPESYGSASPAEGNPSGALLPAPLPRPPGPGEPFFRGVAARPVFCSPGIPFRLRSHPAGLPSARLTKRAAAATLSKHNRVAAELRSSGGH